MAILLAVSMAVSMVLTGSDAWDFCVEEVGVEACLEMSDDEIACIYEADGMDDCGEVAP